MTVTDLLFSLRTEVLAEAAQVARRAPSVFNTQPWRWRVGGAELELYGDHGRQLEVDPAGRMLTISCGAALHHARVALAASGHTATVDRLPDPDRPDLFARIRVTGAHEPDIADLALCEAIGRRQTDRRGFADSRVPDVVVARLRATAEEQGAGLYVVRDEQLPMLAAAVAWAGELELADPDYRAELIRWTNRPLWSGDGVPVATAVHTTPRRVPVREFSLGPQDGMDPGPGSDRGAVYTILHGDQDDTLGWLRAGEALSAVLLAATAVGLRAAPASDAIEVTATRELLRGQLSGLGYPFLVLRFGFGVVSCSTPATPRRDRSEIIDEQRQGS
jgi:nitroreductase